MKEVSEKINWLLEFANFGREAGKLSPPTRDALERKKRTPLFNDKKLLESKYGPDYPIRVDEDGQKWLYIPETTQVPKAVWEGKNIPFPLEEFRKLVKEKGIPPLRPEKILIVTLESEVQPLPKRVTYNDIVTWPKAPLIFYEYDLKSKKNAEDEKAREKLAGIRFVTRIVLSWIAKGKKRKPPHPLAGIQFSYDEEPIPSISLDGNGDILLHHNGSLPNAVRTYLLDLWLNHKELCDRLGECPTCGRFWLKKGKEKYCSTQCRKKFGQDYREDDARRKKIQRDRDKKKQEAKKAEKGRLQLEEDKKYREEEKKYRDYFEQKKYEPENIEKDIQKYLHLKKLPFKEYLKKHRSRSN